MDKNEEQMGLFNEAHVPGNESLSPKESALQYIGGLLTELAAANVTPEAQQINELFSGVQTGTRLDYEKVCKEAKALYDKAMSNSSI